MPNGAEKQHAVLIPYPAQGHINPMLHLAKLLHAQGFHITFVLTDFNYGRLVRSHTSDAVKGLPSFRFASIPDGLPPSSADATQDIPSLCQSAIDNFLAPFSHLLADLADDHLSPPVSCIVSDGVMTFTLDAAREFGIPEIFLWTASACGFVSYNHYRHLVDSGLVPLKDMDDVRNGTLEKEVDWVPGLMPGMRLRDFPSFIRTTDPDDIMLNYFIRETSRLPMASAIVLNTFDALENRALVAMQDILPPMYTVGPLSTLVRKSIPDENPLVDLTGSLWREDASCLEWLNGRPAGSVVYVNFGSITVMSTEELVEFAWGLANSGYNFLWIVRPDLVKGETPVLPSDFLEEIEERGMMVGWCDQEKVLEHPAVGVFLTHCGWNSTLESLCGGVPMICWPFFAEQQTNCRYARGDWGWAWRLAMM
ncbi:hypothetical protein HPP92_005486 [Vanilla planifolia]|uniref:Glycosyltransferase n=1 Tax=Vanilla planifolia TaxID=51239 RepID=A0A835RZN0_VANPL|nr:hypothetical protein HPP92_005486 [Vanilla planifolia]